MRFAAIFTLALLLSWALPKIGLAKNRSSDTEDPPSNTEDTPYLMVTSFWTGDCQDCAAMNSLLHKLEPEYSGKIAFLYIDIREKVCEDLGGDNPVEVMECFGLSHVPAQLFLKDSEIVAAHEGLMDEKTLRELLDSMLE